MLQRPHSKQAGLKGMVEDMKQTFHVNVRYALGSCQ